MFNFRNIQAAIVIISLFLVVGMCSSWAEAGEGVPLRKFAELGKQDTPEKAAARPFMYPAKGNFGLWVGSIPRGGKVFITPSGYDKGLSWKNAKGKLLFLAEGGIHDIRTSDYVLQPKIDWIEVGYTPLFLRDLMPGDYVVNIVPVNRLSSGGMYETPKYIMEDKRDDKMITRICLDDRIDSTPLYNIRLGKNNLASVCSLTYYNRTKLDYVMKLYPTGKNFQCELSREEVLKSLREQWELESTTANQAAELLERGGFLVCPPIGDDDNPRGRATITPEGKFICEVTLGVLSDGRLKLTQKGHRLVTGMTETSDPDILTGNAKIDKKILTSNWDFHVANIEYGLRKVTYVEPASISSKEDEQFIIIHGRLEPERKNDSHTVHLRSFRLFADSTKSEPMWIRAKAYDNNVYMIGWPGGEYELEASKFPIEVSLYYKMPVNVKRIEIAIDDSILLLLLDLSKSGKS